MTKQPTASPSPLPEAFYLPQGVNIFESTRATMSPWDSTMQHGGPPAALLARAIEEVIGDENFPIARLTIDMLGPIPQGTIRTEATILRPGKRVSMVEAKLWANDSLAVSATAWAIRATAGSTAEYAHHLNPPELPEPQEQEFFPGIPEDWGYGQAFEWRYLPSAQQPHEPAKLASVWVRQHIPLVAGELPSPVQRVAVIADSANGISSDLPYTDWLFIPPSMSLTLGRAARSEWVNLSARSLVSDEGRGVTEGRIYDASGFVGTVSQPILVTRRG